MKLRDSFHIFIGFSIMYLLGCLTEFSTYTLTSKLIGVPIASAFVGFSIGFFWEWMQSYFMKVFFDFNDVIRTSIGTFLGGLFSLFIVNYTLIYITCFLSLILVLNDLKYIFRK